VTTTYPCGRTVRAILGARNHSYDYDRTVTDPSAVGLMFRNGNVERQGQMFQEYVLDDLYLRDVRKFFLVQDYVWNR